MQSMCVCGIPNLLKRCCAFRMWNPILWIVYLARFVRSSFWIINIEAKCNAVQWYSMVFCVSVRVVRIHSVSKMHFTIFQHRVDYISAFLKQPRPLSGTLKQTKTQNQHKIVYRMKLCIQICHKRNTFSSQIKQCIRAAKHEHWTVRVLSLSTLENRRYFSLSLSLSFSLNASCDGRVSVCVCNAYTRSLNATWTLSVGVHNFVQSTGFEH